MTSRISAFALSLALLASTATVFALNSYAADAPAAVSDSDITQQAEAALAADPVLKSQKIKVSTEKGEVHLTGVVTEQDMMVAAGHLVEKIPGVKYVLNEIDNEDYLREQAAKK